VDNSTDCKDAGTGNEDGEDVDGGNSGGGGSSSSDVGGGGGGSGGGDSSSSGGGQGTAGVDEWESTYFADKDFLPDGERRQI
jgi:hypothetical protein